MKSRDIAFEVVETVTAGLSGSIEIDTVKCLHDIDMIRDLVVRNDRLAESLVLDILAVVLTDRDRRIDDVRDHEHDLSDFLGQFLLFDIQSSHLISHRSYLLLRLFGFFLLALTHEHTDLLTDGISLGSEILDAGLGLTEFLIVFDDFIYQRELVILKLLLDVLFDDVRICADEFDIQHINASKQKI